jgi:hypothetical protein
LGEGEESGEQGAGLGRQASSHRLAGTVWVYAGFMETFVDIAQYQGTCYKAANWMLLGETSGRDEWIGIPNNLSSPKHIYVYPLRRDFRAILCGESKGVQ